jgi:hypothetical protein
MSVAATVEAVEERRKIVTRRLGWRFLRPGDTLTLVDRSPRTGKPWRRLAEVEVVSVDREPLRYAAIPHRIRFGGDAVDEPHLEGFTDMTPEDFVAFFCDRMSCTPETIVTRIEWRYLDDQ